MAGRDLGNCKLNKNYQSCAAPERFRPLSGLTNVSAVFKMEAVILLCQVVLLLQWKPGVQFKQFKRDTNHLRKV